MMLATTAPALQGLLDFPTSPGAERMAELGFSGFLLVIVISAAAGLFVSQLYRIFFRARATGSEIHRAFPLISLSVTAIFISIQFSLPLSLGLLGALSIVRFRTPVKEPEEIGFLMLVVATSLCCATFNLLFLGVVLLVATGMLCVLHLRRGVLGGARKDGMVVLSMPSEEFRAQGTELLRLLEQRLPGGRLDALNEGEEESVLSYSFPKLAREGVVDLTSALHGVCAAMRTDLYFNRSA